MKEQPLRYPIMLEGRSAALQPFLRRYPQTSGRAPAVVLLHGGNTSGDTFLAPDRGLAGFLFDSGFDVWILEWRSSPHIVTPLLRQPPLGGSARTEYPLFTLDAVVSEEIPRALKIVRDNIDENAQLSLLGHCFGSAAVSMAVARGETERFGISNVVLSTLGLFVEVPWSGWVKAEDFIMERVLHNTAGCRRIDPFSLDEWPADLRSAYDRWPDSWLPDGSLPWLSMLRHLSFMFGQPYSIDRLDPSLRGPAIQQYFGPMHIGLFLHASQMVRRGYTGPFNAPDVIDRGRILRAPQRSTGADISARSLERFRDLQVTLLAAGDNQLWHRDSVDLMYEWLRRLPYQSGQFTKQVFPGYNLQELMWGVRAREEVFPVVARALCARPRRARAARVPTPDSRPSGGGYPDGARASLVARRDSR